MATDSRLTIASILNDSRDIKMPTRPLKRKQDESTTAAPAKKQKTTSQPEMIVPGRYEQSQTVGNARSIGDGLLKTSKQCSPVIRQPSLMAPIEQEHWAAGYTSPSVQAPPSQRAQYTIYGQSRSSGEYTIPASQLTSMQMRPDAQLCRVRGSHESGEASPSQRTIQSESSRSETYGRSLSPGEDQSLSSSSVATSPEPQASDTSSATLSPAQQASPSPSPRSQTDENRRDDREPIWTASLAPRYGPKFTCMQRGEGVQISRVRGT